MEQVATWKALPGRTMRLTGATATGRTDITTVEVRTADGRVVLTLPVESSAAVASSRAVRHGSWRSRAGVPRTSLTSARTRVAGGSPRS